MSRSSLTYVWNGSERNCCFLLQWCHPYTKETSQLLFGCSARASIYCAASEPAWTRNQWWHHRQERKAAAKQEGKWSRKGLLHFGNKEGGPGLYNKIPYCKIFASLMNIIVFLSFFNFFVSYSCMILYCIFHIYTEYRIQPAIISPHRSMVMIYSEHLSPMFLLHWQGRFR